MNDAELRAILVELLKELAPDADPSALEDDDSVREELDIDSMDMLRFAQAIKARIGVDVPEVDVPKLDHLEDAVPYLQGRMG